MVKLKRSPKNFELDIDVAKMGNSVFFCGKQQILQQTANSMVLRENLRVCNTASPARHGSMLVPRE